MKPRFGEYLHAAFNARPMGMFVPPNWVGLAAFGALGLINPGFWILGAGVELAYLYALTNSPRFQRTVFAGQLSQQQAKGQRRLDRMMATMPPPDRERYRNLELRCRAILDQQAQTSPDQASGIEAQKESFGRLLWIYLGLLLTRQSITRVMRQSQQADDDRKPLPERLARLQTQLKDTSLRDDLRKSLAGQAQIIEQRIEKQKEAKDKLAFLEAELTRIQEQVELIREQAVLTTDPNVVSQRIDEVSATLGGTTQWIQEQQQIYGQVEDLLTASPPITLSPAPMVKEAQ